MDPAESTALRDSAPHRSEETASVVVRLPPERQARGKKRRWGSALLLGFGGAIAGAAAAMVGPDLFLPASGSFGWRALPLLALPVAWLLVVGFHELGHLVGGWTTGGRFLLYGVGPLMWRRTPTGVRFSWNRHLNLAGGLAACMPLDVTRVTPRRMAVMVAGGPVFSLALTLACAWLAGEIAAEQPTEPALIAGQHALLFAALLSLMIFVLTSLPGIAGGFKSDGRRFFDLLRGDPRSEQEKAVLVLTAAGLTGARPADYDERMIAQALALRDGSLFDLYGHLTAFYHDIDCGRPADAQAKLDHVVAHQETLAPVMHASMCCCYAWLLAQWTGDAVAARAWLAAAGKMEFDPATRLRAEAAVLLAEGKKVEAAAKAREGLVALERKSLSPVKSAFATETFEEILRRAGG